MGFFISLAPPSSRKKSPSETAKENHGEGIHCTTRTKNKAKAFVINFDEPRRRASIPQSVLQRRELAARNKEEECRVSEFSGDSAGTGGTVQNGLNGSLSDSANFLIQKMLQSNNDGPNVEWVQNTARQSDQCLIKMIVW